uniref:Uncharacterized protein n=1 Tax=Manihot esculenta TaxID=3983 RepID=A0A199UBI1_MANES
MLDKGWKKTNWFWGVHHYTHLVSLSFFVYLYMKIILYSSSNIISSEGSFSP